MFIFSVYHLEETPKFKKFIVSTNHNQVSGVSTYRKKLHCTFPQNSKPSGYCGVIVETQESLHLHLLSELP